MSFALGQVVWLKMKRGARRVIVDGAIVAASGHHYYRVRDGLGHAVYDAVRLSAEPINKAYQARKLRIEALRSHIQQCGTNSAPLLVKNLGLGAYNLARNAPGVFTISGEKGRLAVTLK